MEGASAPTTCIYLPTHIKLPDDLKYIPAPAYRQLIVLHRDDIKGARVPFEPACPGAVVKLGSHLVLTT